MSGELPPIRCVSCNKILADKYSAYLEMLEKGITIEEALNRLGLTRYCCRIRLMNPFKTVNRYVDEISVDSNSEANTTDALSSLNSTSLTIVPEEESISLTPLVSIPVLPKNNEKKITRTYE